MVQTTTGSELVQYSIDGANPVPIHFRFVVSVDAPQVIHLSSLAGHSTTVRLWGLPAKGTLCCSMLVKLSDSPQPAELPW